MIEGLVHVQSRRLWVASYNLSHSFSSFQSRGNRHNKVNMFLEFDSLPVYGIATPDNSHSACQGIGYSSLEEPSISLPRLISYLIVAHYRFDTSYKRSYLIRGIARAFPNADRK